MVMTIAALERVLIELGYELIPGTGVKAIQQILLQK
ncbi:hypothetical protein DMNBHIDG_02105 [Candidatus Methanoperedenaceae archaeon GB37]|nr:hypothetical protein DMNBHIDG_02105 [Candidatus Methanoperedenaceae archaeon GB37]